MPITGFLITPQGLEKGLVFLDLGESLLPTEGPGPRGHTSAGRMHPLEAAPPNVTNLVFRAFLSSLPPPGK